MRFLNVLAAAAILLIAVTTFRASAVEMKMHDGKRIAVLVEGWKGNGKLDVYLTSGEKQTVELRDVASIYFSGRPGHFIRTGDQKFIFNSGGHICAAVELLEKGETLKIKSQSLGRHVIPLEYLHGFTALAVEGRAARLADDLMLADGVPPTRENAFLDHIIDRRGLPYAGVVEGFSPLRLEFEHDEQLQRVRIDTFKVAGVRLAEAAKQKVSKESDLLQIGVHCRDGSYLVGQLVDLDPFRWRIRPNWDPARMVDIPASEITRADVLGGRTVFLTQLDPVKTEESTVIAPPQPYRRNTNSQGEDLDVGGFIYHNGLGVHARSKLTYRLGGKFKTFRADVGIDGRLEKEGSVIFSVFGDGKQLYRSPLVRGSISGGGLGVEVSVKDVKELTLSVEPTDDLDQADVANWGAARVTR